MDTCVSSCLFIKERSPQVQGEIGGKTQVRMVMRYRVRGSSLCVFRLSSVTHQLLRAREHGATPLDSVFQRLLFLPQWQILLVWNPSSALFALGPCLLQKVVGGKAVLEVAMWMLGNGEKNLSVSCKDYLSFNTHVVQKAQKRKFDVRVDIFLR